MITPAIDSDLRNWARWCNSGADGGPPIQRQAGSAEGKHVPVAGETFDEPSDRPPPVNVERARIVQSVYDQRLTPAERRVMQAEYAHRLRYLVPSGRGARFSPRKAARMLGVPMWVYSQMLARCGRLVREALG
jgi:hypothetical protein